MSLLDVWVLFLVLGTLAVFAAGAWVVSRLSRRHGEDDPRAGAKLAVAVAASLVLGAGGLYLLMDFQAHGVRGTHDTFKEALKKTIGEGDYAEAAATVPARDRVIAQILLPRLAQANATIDGYLAEHPEAAPAVANATVAGLPPDVAANVTARNDALSALQGAKKDRASAQAAMRRLTPNHAFWTMAEPLVDAGRDGEVEGLVAKVLDPARVTEVLPMDEATVASDEAPCARDAVTAMCTRPLTPMAIEHKFFDAHELRNVPFSEAGPAAFEAQREFNHQMDVQLKLFAYPGLAGLVAAPFVFAGGAILRQAYAPSDSVGFKPYPSKAAGWFLLLLGIGGPAVLLVFQKGMTPPLDLFGLLAIPFAAWVLRDLHKRSAEGQISL